MSGSADTASAPAAEEAIARAMREGYSPSLDYRVTLPAFDGPLDLLLFLIRRDEVDVFDIPVAHITTEYLRMLSTMRELDLDVGGEFLVMAATLLRIKSQMLLPRDETEQQQPDPREELVRRLLEYQRFKAAATELDALADRESTFYRRGSAGPPEDLPFVPHAEEDVTLYHLLDALREVTARASERIDVHRVLRPEVSIEDRIAFISDVLSRKDGVPFVDLFGDDLRRTTIVVTLVAMLELARLGRIYVRQSGPRGQIWVWRIDYGNW